jgi:SWI/SNF-related matrix-associated actin-dependent regulator of chromatin subfamily A protein 2/4
MFNKPLKKEYIYNSDHISFYKIPINNNNIYPYEHVARVATTINMLISNTMFNVSNNVYGDAYSADTYSEQDYSDDDTNNDNDTNNDAVNTNILENPEYEREFDELYNRLQTVNLENNDTDNNNSNDTLDDQGSNYDEEEQNDDDSIS